MIEKPEGGERVVLVHLNLRDPSPISSSIQEFRELALAAGALVIEVITSTRDVPDAQYFIGSGKVEELRAMVETHRIALVLFNHALTPAQERNLERVLKCRVLDRTGLILDIFAKRARTYEGKLQVELAQLKHHSTRLIRGWTHLERQKGGIGLRGPGETQLETDRRLIRDRIKYIKARLDKIRVQRDQGRRSRSRALVPTISLVGYTNAGKSTLFNALTGADVFVANQLFATLDPTIRSLTLPPFGKVVFADTVGFVRQLPHDLVEAFRATLEETRDADLLLHVIDCQDDVRDEHMKQVEAVLLQIGALAVPRIEVYNKIDLLPSVAAHEERDEQGQVKRIFVSARTGAGLALLKQAVMEYVSGEIMRGELHLSHHQSRIRATLFELGAVVAEKSDEEGEWILDIQLPHQKWQQLCLQHPELEQQWKNI